MRASLGALRWLQIAALLTSLAMARTSNVADDATPTEPPGPSSRRTGLEVSEVTYHPAARSKGRILESVEIHNSQPWFQDVHGFRLAGDIDFTFPPNTILPSNAFVVFARVAADLISWAPITLIAPILEGYAGNRPDEAGMVRLDHRNLGALIEVWYSREAPWLAGAAGAGHSLVPTRPSLGQEAPRTWPTTTRVGGSPGTRAPTRDEPPRKLHISEHLAAEGALAPDLVEFHNSGAESMDLSGWVLPDDPFANRSGLPSGRTLASGGFLVIVGAQMGLGLNRSGESRDPWNASRSAADTARDYAGALEKGDLSTARVPWISLC